MANKMAGPGQDGRLSVGYLPANQIETVSPNQSNSFMFGAVQDFEPVVERLVKVGIQDLFPMIVWRLNDDLRKVKKSPTIGTSMQKPSFPRPTS